MGYKKAHDPTAHFKIDNVLHTFAVLPDFTKSGNDVIVNYTPADKAGRRALTIVLKPIRSL